jgi:LppP/LprE lipoprotein
MTRQRGYVIDRSPPSPARLTAAARATTIRRAMVSATGRRRWPARVAGLLGTAALLGSGVAIAVMVMPSPSEEREAPAATPVDDGAAVKEPPPKPKLTPGQRRARRAAIEMLAGEGFEPVRLGDYRFDRELRVLIGRPADDDEGPRRAFFFVKREFIGFDSDAPSSNLRVARGTQRSITLAYGMYTPGDRVCCPSGGTERVQFAWDGFTLAPQSELPDPFVRTPIEG